jgi:hypothetical protein
MAHSRSHKKLPAYMLARGEGEVIVAGDQFLCPACGGLFALRGEGGRDPAAAGGVAPCGGNARRLPGGGGQLPARLRHQVHMPESRPDRFFIIIIFL